MKILKYFATFVAEQLQAMSNSPLGSNPGGIYLDVDTNVRYYIKFPRNPDQAKVEVLSASLQSLMGISNTKPVLEEVDGRIGVKSEWINGLSPVKLNDLDSLDEQGLHTIAKAFAHAVLVKNWDVIGTGISYGQGNIHRAGSVVYSIDTGGSFNFRAQGEHKDYGIEIGEIETLLDPNINKEASEYLKKVFRLSPDCLVAAKQSVLDLDMSDAKKCFDESQLSNSSTLYATFATRRNKFLSSIDDLIKKYDQI